MNLSPDQEIFWQHGFVKVSGTLVMTWIMMTVLAVGAKLITRKLAFKAGGVSRGQAALEIIVTGIAQQIGETGLARPHRYLPFLGTLFLFIALANLGTLIPGFELPTSSLSTTAALALCVFIAVPLFGIR
ncbi:MAG: Sodium-transporting ATPase subunit, partial [Gammaproteobacteria bacterium]|nr:Sodium-transporting ATPase subunit [Gammaproteobacteria bacterium]